MNMFSRPSTFPALLLLAQLLCLVLAVEQKATNAPALAAVVEHKVSSAEAKARHMMRAEVFHGHKHKAYKSAAATALREAGRSEMFVQMLDSGAMRMLHPSAPAPALGRAAPQPAAHIARPPIELEEDKRDALQGKGHGFAWKEDHDSSDEAGPSDDDWDDEATKGTVQDPFDAEKKAEDNSDTSYGDDGEAYDGSDAPIVNVTAEEDATAAPDKGPLKATNPSPMMKVPPPENDVEKLGEGIGAMAYERSPTGSRSINIDLRKRIQLQDFATIGLLLSVFGLTLLLSCCSVYQVADDPSPAAYYSDPKNYQQRVICESHDVDAFLAAFNTQPQNARLRIIGKNPEPGGFRRFLRTLNAHASRPRGLAALLPMRQRRRQAVLFDVALDLTPFITGDGRLSEENLGILQGYLDSKNRLETVLVQKHVDWPLWEDVATNIRQRLRTLGFPGEVEVRFEAKDEVLVYQNEKWSNFVRNRVTQALVVISIVGGAVWIPYVWARSKTTKVETRFTINVDPSRYWELVSDGLSAAEGFQNL